MSIVARLPEVLGPIRPSPAQRGVNVTFERGGRWRTMHVVETPHLELSIEVPELDGIRLRGHAGPATMVAEDASVDDPRWRVRSDAPALAKAIFAEAPWPRRESGLQGSAWPGAKRGPVTAQGVLKTIGALCLGPFGYHMIITDDVAVADPLPFYVIDLDRGIVSIERRGGENDLARALGAVRRLVQIATWPDRVLAGMRDVAAKLGGEVEGERWAAGASAITIRRDDITVRIDHELARDSLRTRVRVLDSSATAYVEGVCLDAESLRRVVDTLVASAGGRRGRAPYR